MYFFVICTFEGFKSASLINHLHIKKKIEIYILFSPVTGVLNYSEVHAFFTQGGLLKNKQEGNV